MEAEGVSVFHNVVGDVEMRLCRCDRDNVRSVWTGQRKRKKHTITWLVIQEVPQSPGGNDDLYTEVNVVCHTLSHGIDVTSMWLMEFSPSQWTPAEFLQLFMITSPKFPWS